MDEGENFESFSIKSFNKPLFYGIYRTFLHASGPQMVHGNCRSMMRLFEPFGNFEWFKLL